jgi:hypothetical protein
MTISPDVMLDWVANSETGARLVYHTGFLVRDRDGDVNVSAAARMAERLRQLGYVNLLQRRIDENSCEYIIERRSVALPGSTP